jgi:hypothetical protein
MTALGTKSANFIPNLVLKILAKERRLLGLRNSTHILQVMDGSHFSKYTTFVIMYGVEINDPTRENVPFTKKPPYLLMAQRPS